MGTEDATGLLFTSTDRASFANRGTANFLTYNDLNLYVNRALDRRAQKVSEVEFVLTKRNGDPVDDPLNPWLVLLNRPNQWHTGRQFWKLVQKYIDITGEAYILASGPPRRLFEPSQTTELWVLPSQLVTVKFSQDGRSIERYEYRSPSGIVTYQPDQIIRIYEPDPISPAQGVSLLRAGVREIETGNDLTEYQANILKNGGFVDGVFTFKTAMTKDKSKLLAEGYREQLAGARKAGTPLFLGEDATYSKLALNPVELGYLESKKLSLDDVATMTGVPRALLARSSDETFANADAALRIFLRETIKPLIESIVTVLDWRLIPDEFDLGFTDPTPANREEIRADLTTASNVFAMTTNEKREALGELGIALEPVSDEAADRVLIPFSVSPLGGGNDQQPQEPVQNQKAAKLMEHPLRDPDIRQKWGGIQLKRLDKRTVAFRDAVRAYFREQAARIVANIPADKVFAAKGIADSFFDIQLEAKLAKGFAVPLIRRILEESGQESMSFVGSEFEFSLTTGIESWLDTRGNIFADEITATTYTKLTREFSDSFEARETRQELIARIQSVYGGFDETRATTIARTETHGAMQKGTVEGYRQAGVPIKIWVWASGVQGGIRPDHLKMDGEERPLDVPFSNGLMYPGDPSGDPGDTVNCECSA